MDRRTFLAAAAVSVSGSVAIAQQKEKVKIVSSLPRQGSPQGQTDGIANAIKLAIADFEKVVPFEVQYLDWDDATAAQGQWVAEKEKDNAENAVKDKDVLAFIGPYNSGAARVSMPILNKAGLVQISPSTTWPGLTKKGPTSDPDEPDRYRPGKKITFCRVCPHDASQGPLSAQFVVEELKVKSVYVLDDKELYGHGVATLFKKTCEEKKVKVLGHESINTTRNNFKELMKKIKEKNPDLVYFGGTTQSKGPQIALDMKSEEVNCPLMVPDGCYEQAFVDGAGEATFDTLKCFVTIGGIDPAYLKGAGAEFVKKYKEKHKKDAEAYAVYGYEAAAVVLEALRVVGKKDREAIRKAVVGTKDFAKGLLGKWSFDADGDTTFQQLTVATIEKGKFKSVKVLGTG
ncbi:MAG: branched-chain amino acid ABC transporter substrate-binding protein [Planctomycetia bacterium]|nr:branched-chain amino acid ABC transporter substrate-binding protein [Planctomycetia bacterium]